MKENKSGRNEIEVSQDLSYGRELFLQMFQDSTPLSTLGYSTPQIEEARRALKQLENEKGQSFYSDSVTFKDEDNFYSSELKHSFGGKNYSHDFWHLNARRDIVGMAMSQIPPDAPEEVARAMQIRAAFGAAIDIKVKTLKENENLLAAVTCFPEDVDTENIDTLVNRIALGNGFATGMSFEVKKPTLWNKFRQNFGGYTSPMTYRAAWLDDRTKRDLVIEYTDYHHKRMAKHYEKMRKSKYYQPEDLEGADISDSRLLVWRRLGEQELDGKRWIPFGARLNTTSEQAMAAFAQEDKVVSGQFAYQGFRR